MGITAMYGQAIFSLMIQYEDRRDGGSECRCLPSRRVKPPPRNKEDHEYAEFTINGRAGERLTAVYAYKLSDLGAASPGDEDMWDAPPGNIEDLYDAPPEESEYMSDVPQGESEDMSDEPSEASENMGDAPQGESEDSDVSSPEDIAVIGVRKSNLASVAVTTGIANTAQLKTNLGRSALLGPPHLVALAYNLPEHPFELCHVTVNTITGLFATRVSDFTRAHGKRDTKHAVRLV